MNKLQKFNSEIVFRKDNFLLILSFKTIELAKQLLIFHFIKLTKINFLIILGYLVWNFWNFLIIFWFELSDLLKRIVKLHVLFNIFKVIRQASRPLAISIYNNSLTNNIIWEVVIFPHSCHIQNTSQLFFREPGR